MGFGDIKYLVQGHTTKWRPEFASGQHVALESTPAATAVPPPRQKKSVETDFQRHEGPRALADQDPPPTFNALEPTVTPVCSMPSARPSWSTFRRKGVTRVTYVAPDHFLRKLGAHVSVEPPTLSRIKSNLGRKHPNKILVSVYLGLQSPPYPPSPVSCRGHFSQVHKRRCAYHPAEGRPGDNGEGDAHPLDSWLFSKVSQM